MTKHFWTLPCLARNWIADFQSRQQS